jgi:phage FluMu gp28-like protein
MSEERKAEIDRRVDFSFYQQYLQSEVDWLESCAWGHEGVDCECKEIVKEMREQREKWWQETLEKRKQASEEIVSKVEEVQEKETSPSTETVSEVKETPEEGTSPSEEAASDDWW